MEHKHLETRRRDFLKKLGYGAAVIVGGTSYPRKVTAEEVEAVSRDILTSGANCTCSICACPCNPCGCWFTITDPSNYPSHQPTGYTSGQLKYRTTKYNYYDNQKL